VLVVVEDVEEVACELEVLDLELDDVELEAGEDEEDV